MSRRLLFSLVVLLGCSVLVEAQTSSPTRRELSGVRHAGPGAVNPSSASFAIGLSADGNKTFIESAKSGEVVEVSGIIRPETGHSGLVDVFVVERVNLGAFVMRNESGAFVPWNGSVSSLVPYLRGQSAAQALNVSMFSGKLSAGDHRFFLGYMAADGILRYTPIALRVDVVLDTDGDGIPDDIDPDDDNDQVSDANDPYPLNASRTMAIAPAYPKVNGIFQFPDFPAVRQAQWVLSQLATSGTSIEDINARFTSGALASTPAADIQALLQTVRTSTPNAVVVEPITVTPTFFRALIGTAGNTTSGRYLSISTRYATGQIESLSAAAFQLTPGYTTPANRTLTMAQAVEKLAGMTAGGSGSSVLVARIQDNKCVPIAQHNATTQRSTGSVYKEWILGGLAKAINDGAVSPTAQVPLVASEIVANTPLSREPLGTIFPLLDMATLMMGNSDNSATDHIHELAGRSRIEEIVRQFNHSRPELLTPFLSSNEVRNLFMRVSLADARAYRDGTEQYQRDYLNNVIVPFGPASGSFLHTEMFVNGLVHQASPMDICAGMAGLRQLPDTSPGFKIADLAYSSEAVLQFVRSRWERVWFKGGSLDAATGTHVLAYSWMLESDSKGTFVVVSMHNDLTQNLANLDVPWTLARILQLVGDGAF